LANRQKYFHTAILDTLAWQRCVLAPTNPRSLPVDARWNKSAMPDVYNGTARPANAKRLGRAARGHPTSGRLPMLSLSRRNVILSAAGAAAAFGLSRPVTFIDAAQAQAPGAGQGFKSFKNGSIDMTMLYDGMIDRPNAAGFVKNASVDDVKAALTASGLADTSVPNPFTIPIARTGGKTILFDAGTGGQVGPGTGLMADNMKAAGIDPASVTTVLVSHFHPDHISGLMAKDTNAPIYPNAELVMPEAEYAWWTDAAVFTKLPETRHGLAKRIQAVFPGWKDKGQIRLVGDNVEVAPGGVRARPHTRSHRLACQLGRRPAHDPGRHRHVQSRLPAQPRLAPVVRCRWPHGAGDPPQADRARDRREDDHYSLPLSIPRRRNARQGWYGLRVLPGRLIADTAHTTMPGDPNPIVAGSPTRAAMSHRRIPPC
jgi:glyoxylase-like metal-dependent hydrolase (beta-lactamase superfamily II)